MCLRTHCTHSTSENGIRVNVVVLLFCDEVKRVKRYRVVVAVGEISRVTRDCAQS